MAGNLNDAELLIRYGDRVQAQALLAHILKQDLRNAQAWYLLARCVSDPVQQRQCLTRCLAIDPDHSLTRAALAALDTPPIADATPPEPPMAMIEAEPMANDGAATLEEPESEAEPPPPQPEEVETTAETPAFRPQTFSLSGQMATQAFDPQPFELATPDEADGTQVSVVKVQLPVWLRQPKT